MAAKKKKAPAKKAKEMLLVQSKVKEYVRSSGMNCAGDLAEAINEAVYWHLDSAVRRAGANGRKTVRGDDA